MKHLLLLFALLLCGVPAVAQDACHTPMQVAPILADLNPDPLQGSYCVTVYIEVDHDIVLDKGTTGSRVYVEGLLSEVAALYAAQDITLSFITYYWDTPSPYSGTSTGELLNQFREYRAQNGGHDGDVAQLLSYQASGGIAFVDVICRESFGYGYSAIHPTYETYPNYSWSVMVISHELGHNLGSPHTQSCSWPGGAIDSCSPTEGACDEPGYPDGGGTIMSYCHLRGTVGINFRKGFHDLPLALMKNRIAGATCVECTDNPDGPEPPVCEANPVIIELQLDNYATETTWRVLNDTGAVVATSPRYGKLQMNTYHADTLCLPDGCYAFEIDDVDGLAGYGCGEGMYIVSTSGRELSSGQRFAGTETTRFCLGSKPPPDNCAPAPLDPAAFVNYANQHRNGVATALPAGGVQINGNTWQAFALDYEVTERTVIRGELRVQAEGEIHAIVVSDNIRRLDPSHTLRLAGTQPWGREAEQVAVGQGWQTFEIPVGQWLPNQSYTHLALVNDHDVFRPNVIASWRNIEVCESGAATVEKVERPQVQGLVEDETEQAQTTPAKPHPNPVTDTLRLPSDTNWFLTDLTGRMIAQGQGREVPMRTLPAGVYLLHDGTAETHKIIKR